MLIFEQEDTEIYFTVRYIEFFLNHSKYRHAWGRLGWQQSFCTKICEIQLKCIKTYFIAYMSWCIFGSWPTLWKRKTRRSAHHNEAWLHSDVYELFAWLKKRHILKCGQLQCCQKMVEMCFLHQSLNVQSSSSRCPFGSSQCGLSRQPDIGAAGVALTTWHWPPWRPVLQCHMPPLPQQWAASMSAMWWQRGICPRKTGVKGHGSGDQQAARPHILHLWHPGLSTE